MMSLWKETFHDSDSYIRLVFDAYFDPANVRVRKDGDTLVASLLGVPYGFSAGRYAVQNERLRGMYLCGLATRPEYRRRGIMARLMKEAEQDAYDRGFDMTFLIPADDHLREYYRKMGYVDVSFRKDVPVGNLRSGEGSMKIYSVSDLAGKGYENFLTEIADWCRGLELRSRHPVLLHSRKDMLAVLSENENAIFITDDTFDLKYPILAKMRAVVFPDASPNEKRKVRILKSFFKDEDCKDGEEVPDFLTKAVRRVYPDSDVSFMLPCISSSDGCPYVMAKFLRLDGVEMSDCRNPVFDISLMLD